MADNETLHMKKRAFLTALAESGIITKAAKSAGISRQMHYLWLADDPDGSYAAAVKDAEAAAGDLMEEEALRRAVYGWEEPVFHLGKQVSMIRRYDSTMLIFMLKGAKPEKYRERLEHTGKDGAPIALNVTTKRDLSALTDDELAAFEVLLAKTGDGA